MFAVVKRVRPRPAAVTSTTVRVVAGVAAVSLALILALITGLEFVVSYGNSPDSYTGQGWDQAASWLLLALTEAGIALALVATELPARVRRARSAARSNGHDLIPWLRMQTRPFLIRNLLSFNLPIAALLSVPVVWSVNVGLGTHAPPWSLPTESLLGAVAAAFGLTCFELRLLHRAQVDGAKLSVPPTSGLSRLRCGAQSSRPCDPELSA